jgi:predicted PurR-regulated permease PerM
VTRRFIFWTIVILAFLVFLFAIRSILLPFVLGIFTAYFLDPAADKIEKLRLSRTSATALITGGFFLSALLLCLLIVPQLVHQLSGLVAALPSYIQQYESEYAPLISQWLGALPSEHLENLKHATKDMASALVGIATSAAGGLFQSGMVVVHLLSLLLITPVVTFYLLRDWDGLVERLFSLLPRDTEHVIREQLCIIDRTLAGFIRGQTNVCMILAAYYAIGLSLAGLNFAVIIGIATGFLVIIPYIGIMFGTLVGVMVAFFQFGDIESVAMVLAIFVSGQIIEGTFITPKLVGDKVGLHPVWIIFGMMAGGTLLGFVGILLAVPLTAVIGVLVRFGLSRYLVSDYYKGAPAAKSRKA